MKRILGVFSALVMAAAMAVAPVLADEATTTPGPETTATPGTEATAAPGTEATATPGTEATAAPKPEVDPITPLDVTALPKGTQIKFDDAEATYSEAKKYGEYVAVYANENNKINSGGSNKTINGVSYTTCLKMGGTVVYDTSDDPAPALRTISVTPAAEGILIVDIAHSSGADSEARHFAAYQNGEELSAVEIAGGATGTLKVDVAANEPVYLYGQDGGINIYGIRLSDFETEYHGIKKLPMGTTASAESVTVPEDGDKKTVISETGKIGDYILAILSGTDSIDIDNSNKKFDGREYTKRIKLGKAVFEKDVLTSRALLVVPAADGTLKADFSTTNDTEAKTLTAIQEGISPVTKEAAAGQTATLSAEVKADIPIYIYGAAGANVYGITLTETGAEPPVSSEPPTETGSPSEPPTETVSPSEPPAVKGTCAKIEAHYANGVLESITVVDDKFRAADIPDTVTNTDTDKTFYWDSATGMKPVTKADFEQDTPATPTPAPTPIPGDDDIEWGWQASEESIGMTKGTELISGLTTLFDNNSTNKAYIAGAENGAFEEDLTKNASMLKFVPEKDGVLKVKIVDFGDKNKEKTLTAMICEAGTQEDASAQSVTEQVASIILSREVEKGKTYYVTAKGTKMRFAAAAFTEQSVAKTWAVSAASVGMEANTELIPGLTTLFANTSTNNKYISGADNGKIDGGVGSGTALKYVAASDGTLSVTMIDVGVGKKPVIYDADTREDVFSYKATQEKETVILTAEVVSGHTYYITATGTKGRFSAASFTPKAEGAE